MISAKVIADSVTEAGKRITTFELNYPRFIHSEFMTHRQFSRNAASSRAIPVEKVISQVEENPAMPIHWGKNQAGMQAKEEVESPETAAKKWIDCAAEGAESARYLMEEGLHKQIVNRILEPFQHIKVVCTATEYANFFNLRAHQDAQPEIQALAFEMMKAMDGSKPELLLKGDWHLPYVNVTRHREEGGHYVDGAFLSNDDALKISASLCAQVSYRKSDESLDKALKIYEQLVTMRPVHASPFEHQASPMTTNIFHGGEWEKGMTHVDRYGNFWSGNFKGWVQNRQLIEGAL